MENKHHVTRSNIMHIAKLILIVEDDAGVGEFIQQALTEETPYQVELVPDGLQALDVTSTIIPDLILMDYQLPHINGAQCVERIRSLAGFEDVPVVMMSANFPAEVRKIENLVLLEKPFDLDTLLHLIDQLIQLPPITETLPAIEK